MKINRKELKEALEKIIPALPPKALGKDPSFLFSKKEIVAYNGMVGIVYPFKTDFSLELPMEEFYKIISLSDLDEIDLEIKKSTSNLMVKGKGMSAEVVGYNIIGDIDLIDGILKAKKKAEKIPSNLKEAFELCLFSTASIGPLALQCLSIQNGYVLSTDSYRVSRHKIGKFPNMLIPSIAVENIIKYNICEYYLDSDNSRIYFLGDDGIVICSQLIMADFPSCSSFFKNFDDKEILIPKQIKESIDVVSIFAGNDESEKKIDKKIHIEIAKHKWILKGKNDYGWLQKEIASGDKSDLDINFFINPFLLKQVIDRAISMFYANDDKKILFKNKNFEHILALSEEN